MLGNAKDCSKAGEPDLQSNSHKRVGSAFEESSWPFLCKQRPDDGGWNSRCAMLQTYTYCIQGMSWTAQRFGLSSGCSQPQLWMFKTFWVRTSKDACRSTSSSSQKVLQGRTQCIRH